MNLLDSYFEVKIFSNPKIQREYQVIIEKLLNQFGQNLELIGQEDLVTYLNGPFRFYTIIKDEEEVIKEYASTTYEKNINIIKSFLNTIFSNSFINFNYAEIIEASKNTRIMKFDSLPSAAEIIAIQKHLYSTDIKNDYFALRDLVVFNLIFHSGLSTEELASLSIGDTGFQGNDYVVQVQKPVLRIVKLNTNDVTYLSHLIYLRESVGAKDEAIFISNKHKSRMARRSFSYLINEVCKIIYIDANPINTYSAEKFKQAGIAAALSVGYPKDKMREEMQVSEKYFSQRFKHIEYQTKIKSYADLFKE